MEQEYFITQKEKHQLKVNVNFKHMKLINKIALNSDSEGQKLLIRCRR
ncbi:unnamed protein product [Paramecium sonneborni]|uniref:Uncharacterized protein n=1 Tax=Paramecium sonneborni TaxID=65129 RepID=A0A8S1RDX3_9CILI|nr:unnamed protein product [Paramecium sonneborni]